jgi:phosphohistidine phosphatase
LPIHRTHQTLKKIFLIRHAKSSWDDPAMKDFDRPLNTRGERDAPFMAAQFNQSHEVGLYLSSPAIRALNTASFFHKNEKNRQIKLLQDHRIYEASLQNLLTVLVELPDSLESVALFGHNPGLSHLIAYITGDFVDMPTCGIAEIEFHHNTWKAIGQDTATLVSFDYPKRHQP